MIQPITLSYPKVHNNQRKCLISFKTQSAALEDKQVSAKQVQSNDFLKYLKEKDVEEKKEKRNGLIIASLFSAAAIGSFFLLPTVLKKSNGKSAKKIGSNFSQGFSSLKEDKNIPTLDTCKSINKKLRTFLQNQVDYTKATKEDLEKTGMPKSANRLLMHGAPGSGKSYFAKIFAKTIDAEYMEIKYSDISKQYIGEHLENMRDIFENIIEHAQRSPNKKFVVNFNEIDSLAQSVEALSGSASGHNTFKLEERSVFLTYIEDLAEKTPNVILIASTNMSPKNSRLDSAVLSRFKNVIEVPNPDKECILEALKANLRTIPEGEEFIKANNKKLEQFSQSLVNRKASFRDLNNIVDSSKNQYLRDTLKNKNSKYKFEYLENAKNTIEYTDGEIFRAGAKYKQ